MDQHLAQPTYDNWSIGQSFYIILKIFESFESPVPFGRKTWVSVVIQYMLLWKKFANRWHLSEVNGRHNKFCWIVWFRYGLDSLHAIQPMLSSELRLFSVFINACKTCYPENKRLFRSVLQLVVSHELLVCSKKQTIQNMWQKEEQSVGNRTAQWFHSNKC